MPTIFDNLRRKRGYPSYYQVAERMAIRKVSCFLMMFGLLDMLKQSAKNAVRTSRRANVILPLMATLWFVCDCRRLVQSSLSLSAHWFCRYASSHGARFRSWWCSSVSWPLSGVVFPLILPWCEAFHRAIDYIYHDFARGGVCPFIWEENFQSFAQAFQVWPVWLPW